MELIVAGRTVQLPHQLGQQMDQAFAALYASCLGGNALIWKAFEEAAFQFFASNKAAKSGEYFSNFTPLWHIYRESGNLEAMEGIWKLALRPADRWDGLNKEGDEHNTRKGTPYYFWGMTALFRGELDKCYSLMHQAYEEDKRADSTACKELPAFYFVSLNYEKTNQACHFWIMRQAELIENAIKKYSAAFTLADFRRRFLESPPDADSLFLFAYVVGRLIKFSEIPQNVVRNEFAAQLEVNILFDLALVIDAAIKENKTAPIMNWMQTKNSKKPKAATFIDLAELLLDKAGHPLTNGQLREINGRFQDDFESTLKALLDGQYSSPNVLALNRPQSDVALAYGLRNCGAHDVSAYRIIFERFSEIRQALFNTLFSVVDFLYPAPSP